MKVKLIVLMLALAFCASPAAGTILWTEGFEDGGSGSVEISTAFPGVWSGPAGSDNEPRLLNESFAIRPAGMTSTTRATNGPTSNNICSSRSLGATYTSGLLTVTGWLDSRSSDGNSSNFAGFGFSSTDVNGFPFMPDICARYVWSEDLIGLLEDGTLVGAGNAHGTNGVSPTYSNIDPVNYNQWQHVKIELDLDFQLVRFYLDTDQSTGGLDGPWNQLGVTLPTGPRSIGYITVLTSRDGGVDDIVVDHYQTVLLDGDVNLDGFVGGDDLNTIITNWGLSGASRLQGDLTGEGDVGQADYDEVFAHWGEGTPLPPEGSTPEPLTLSVLALGGGLCLLRPRRLIGVSGKYQIIKKKR